VWIASEVADVWTNIGKSFMEEAQSPQALQAFIRAWQIVRVALGTEHPKFFELSQLIEQCGGNVASLLGTTTPRKATRSSAARQRSQPRHQTNPAVALFAVGWF
jgi:hypothetical protein